MRRVCSILPVLLSLSLGNNTNQQTSPIHLPLPIGRQLPHLLPLGSNKEVHKGFIPCCVSFLPDLCLPKYLDFFDHENKCQAGIQFTELELKPADDNRKERKTKSAEYPQLNAS